MPIYSVMFIRQDGAEEEDIGNAIRLQANERDAAEDEVFAMPRPKGAEGFKLYHDQRYEGPKLWFDL